MRTECFTRNRYDFDVAVIGAGSGGLTVAVGAHKLGLRTALIEGHLFGGDCLNFGCVPSKALISAARVAHTVRQAARFGIHCDGGEPRTDWAGVQAHIRSVQEDICERASRADAENSLSGWHDPHRPIATGIHATSGRTI